MTKTSMKATAILTVAISGGILGGCASAPPALDKIAVAKSSIERAEQAGAGSVAGADLHGAREKVEAAENASEHQDAKLANRMAEQADADARVAEAQAVADKSHKAAAEVDKSLDTLRQETMRPVSQSTQ